MRNEYKSLCWKCEKSCNSNLCEWVKNCSKLSGVIPLTREEILKLTPKGVELDENNYIVKCSNFVRDSLTYTRSEHAKKRNLTQREYCNKTGIYKNLVQTIFNITDEEYEEIFSVELLEKYTNEILNDKGKVYSNIVNGYLIRKSIRKLAQENAITFLLASVIVREFKIKLENKLLKEFSFLKKVKPSNKQQNKNCEIITKPLTQKQQESEQKRTERQQKQQAKFEEEQEKILKREYKRKQKESKLKIQKCYSLTKEQRTELLNIEDLEQRENLKDDMLFFNNLNSKIWRWGFAFVVNLEKIKNEELELKKQILTLHNEEFKNEMLNKLEQTKIKKINALNDYLERIKEQEQRKKEKAERKAKRKKLKNEEK